MATPTPKRPPAAYPDFTSRYPPRPPAGPPEVVDPIWLLKALGITVGAAVILSYLTICFLVYQGNWQRILHPSPTITRTPATLGIPFETIPFDSAATGHPRLTAWSIPGPKPLTILFLHDGVGSLSTALDRLALLHRSGVSIFAIDYRGFGASEGPHPTEARMSEDTAAALDYLLNTRHLPPSAIVPYGTGMGASLAAALVAAHPALPAVIIDNPDLEAETRAADPTRSRLIPIHLLIRDRFDLPAHLTHLPGPKLLITAEGPTAPAQQTFFHTVADPKITVTLPPQGDAAYLEALSRFFDQYLPQPTPEALP